MQKFPQILINVKLGNAVASNIMQSSLVNKAIQAAEHQLSDNGRVLLRPSGTEPLIRVMVEGRDQDQVKECAESIADAVRSAI